MANDIEFSRGGGLSLHGLYLLIIVAFVSWGCPEEQTSQVQDASFGGDSASSDAGSLGNEEVREVRSRLIEAQCAKIFECCSSEQRQQELGIGGNQQQCTERLGLFSNSLEVGGGSASALSIAVNGDRVEFDSGKAESCIESFESQTCAELDRIRAVQSDAAGCTGMIIPQVEVEEPCRYDWECRTGACRSPSSDADQQVCVELAEEGEDCSGALECREGLYCDTFEQECFPAKKVGKRCSSNRFCRSDRCANRDGDRVCVERTAVCSGGGSN